MLEWLHFIRGGCVGKGTQDSNHIVALNDMESCWNWKALSRWSSVLCVMCLPGSLRNAVIIIIISVIIIMIIISSIIYIHWS